MEGTSTEEVLLKREIEDLPVVSSLSFIHAIGRDKTGYRVNLVWRMYEWILYCEKWQNIRLPTSKL
jgi:hypothetical protein